MTAYLLNSCLCLLLTYGLYKIWLENESIHRFKRFYLLASLLASAGIPFIPGTLFNLWPDHQMAAISPDLPSVLLDRPAVVSLPEPDVVTSPADTLWAYWWLLLYFMVTALLTLRFVRNCASLLHQAHRQPKRLTPGATLIRATGPNVPYTFLWYIFIDEAAFDRDDMDGELLTHELAHARQWHTLDVLLIELLLCIGWFNPLLWQFRKAIQLNHEFLADEAVNQTYQRISHYQTLILSRMHQPASVALTSALTFQTTKQRFMMMTKHTSLFRVWLAGGATFALLLVLVAFLSAPTVAQTTQPTQPPMVTAPRQAPRTTNVSDFEQRYGDKFVAIPVRRGKPIVRKTYSELSPDEKKRVVLIPPQDRKTPSEAEFNSWKNPKKFGVWVDGKRARNFANTSLKASDIASYSGSYVHKNARQPEGYLYQMDLMTNSYYEAYLKESYRIHFWFLSKEIRLKRNSVRFGHRAKGLKAPFAPVPSIKIFRFLG
ncbi:hypothetical protein BN8_01459 [Fibrisoma limi BUZ 3]|uniref:Peptidase M56 domain-containing protein n=1 Tax=Fibrisoma limi BUZ 3 TaxID=1185876 RepID=I2GEY1_9BACT|nr:M56 family metallopeptidase [Fibrisoma limi]CCH52456.1 hypothetical protein BN8_01459 [Fibrisoma limi BUZ 3]